VFAEFLAEWVRLTDISADFVNLGLGVLIHNCVFFHKNCLVYSQHANVNKRLKQLKQRPELLICSSKANANAFAFDRKRLMKITPFDERKRVR